jgi:hypothetical protein
MLPDLVRSDFCHRLKYHLADESIDSSPPLAINIGESKHQNQSIGQTPDYSFHNTLL